MSEDGFGPRVTSSTVLAHEGGLHARPAILLTQAALRFSAKVWIAVSATGPWTDAKSIARVMALKAPNRSTLFFTAEGDDADVAVNALVKLVQTDFARE